MCKGPNKYILNLKEKLNSPLAHHYSSIFLTQIESPKTSFEIIWNGRLGITEP